MNPILTSAVMSTILTRARQLIDYQRPPIPPQCSVEGCENGADPRFGIRAHTTWAPACDAHGGSDASTVALRTPLPAWPLAIGELDKLKADLVPALIEEVDRLRGIAEELGTIASHLLKAERDAARAEFEQLKAERKTWGAEFPVSYEDACMVVDTLHRQLDTAHDEVTTASEQALASRHECARMTRVYEAAVAAVQNADRERCAIWLESSTGHALDRAVLDEPATTKDQGS